VSERSGPRPLVSVVTPVYNGEPYLAECIESVRRQTYGNWEYVIADNCSTDATPEIAASFARQDERIRVVRHDEFLPIIANWNRALRLISADSSYCKVVHADDLLFPECLERLVEFAEAHPETGIIGSYQLRGAHVQLDGIIPYPTNVVAGRDICRIALTGGGFVFGTPTTILMRADLVRERERFYNEANLHADTEACYDVLRTTDFGFVHQILSFTRAHQKAMSTTASRLNTFIAGRLIVLTTYGPVYLDRKEYERRLARMTARYLLFLTRSTARLKVREPAFRQLHWASIRRFARSARLQQVARGIGYEIAALTRKS
jgi:glycosyltransferase involved in cell wall biosynthesis